jgi:5'-methylthioadenosine phosphorylase
MISPIGIIGGSGLYAMEGVKVRERRNIETPFGAPSDPLVLGTLDDVEVVFLPRHGEGHRFLPSEVNYRANIWALKFLGCQTVISVSAVGSLQERHAPGVLRLPEQFIDKTFKRESSFFGDGLVAHLGFADPTSAWLRRQLFEVGRALDLPIENGGCYVNMEGPQFSSRAESKLHQAWGADFIGMTQATEARLAREAELAWATLALVTDFDAWKDHEAGAEGTDIMAVMMANVEKAQRLIRSVVKDLQSGPPEQEPARSALKTALITSPDRVPQSTKDKLKLLIGRYGY